MADRKNRPEYYIIKDLKVGEISEPFEKRLLHRNISYIHWKLKGSDSDFQWFLYAKFLIQLIDPVDRSDGARPVVLGAEEPAGIQTHNH